MANSKMTFEITLGIKSFEPFDDLLVLFNEEGCSISK